jgi:hypothetical protein
VKSKRRRSEKSIILSERKAESGRERERASVKLLLELKNFPIYVRK